VARQKKKSGVSWLSLLVLICIGVWAWYNDQPQNPGQKKPPIEIDVPGEVKLPFNPDIIRIATFNIQVLGESKLSVPEDAARLAAIIRQFDVIAVQELRSKEQNIVPELLNIINHNNAGKTFDALVGPRQGRTASKEQYVYFYNTQRIEPHTPPLAPYTWDDSSDRLHRSPYIARFRVKDVPLEETFTFTLVNIHTDPDEAQDEVNYLARVFSGLRNRKQLEDDVILLGDLNRNSSHLQKSDLASLPDISWVLQDRTPTNTKGTEQYDNIVFDSSTTREYTGTHGVYNFQTRFELTDKQAQELSDHFPVWAEFTIREAR